MHIVIKGKSTIEEFKAEENEWISKKNIMKFIGNHVKIGITGTQ